MLLRSTGCASLAAGLVSLALLGGPPGCTKELTGTDSGTNDATETGPRDSDDTAPADTDTAPTGPVDADGDGYDTRYDCDDTDPEVHPNADDRTQDDLDQDCSGTDLRTFTSIDAYDTFLCGVATTGQAWCWNGAGWKLEAPTGSYETVSAGSSHACGTTTDGQAICWGSDYDGEIAEVPTAGLSSISAGVKLTCGVLDDLSVACWSRAVPLPGGAAVLEVGVVGGPARAIRATEALVEVVVLEADHGRAVGVEAAAAGLGIEHRCQRRGRHTQLLRLLGDVVALGVVDRCITRSRPRSPSVGTGTAGASVSSKSLVLPRLDRAVHHSEGSPDTAPASMTSRTRTYSRRPRRRVSSTSTSVPGASTSPVGRQVAGSRATALVSVMA